MELLQPLEKGLSVFLYHHHSSSRKHTPSNFLLQPIFLHGFSGSLHMVLLLFLFVSWVWSKIKFGVIEAPEQSTIKTRFSHYKLTLFCCLGLSLFNLVLCLLNLFHWYKNGWSDEKIVTLLDLGLRALAWLAISVYLHTHVSISKFPILLRVWWGVYFSMSCCFLVIDFLSNKKGQSLETQVLVSDVIATIMGLFFSFVGCLGKKESEEILVFKEPLLNGVESNKSNVGESVAPCSNASGFSILTFSWMSKLIGLGYKKALDLEDVPQLAGVDSVKGAFPVFRNKLESDSGSGSRITTIKLVKALLAATWREILLTAFLALVYTLASYVGPYLIDTFVQYLNGRRAFKNEGYSLVSTFFVAKLIECLAQRHWFFRLQQAGIRARAVLVAMIYNKGLSISCQSKQGHTSGEIINFMSVDAERVGDFSWYMHYPWLVVLQVALALVILYKNLGLASVATLVATVLAMLVNVPLGRLQEKFQDKIMKSKDKRMKGTSEVLRNMRILKLQAWEMKFLSKIMELRNAETGWLKKFMYTNAVTSFVFWGAPTFVSVVTFGACMLLGIPLESGKILSALATFRILQEPIYALPDTISMIAQTKVSLDRIATFLSLDDLQHDVIEKLPRGSSDAAIEIIGGNFSWDVSSANPTLKDININVSRGMRVAVCGTVGSGKSSLLSCISGEMPKISGTIRLCGTKAYVAQSPWIQSGKIEENILFGREMDREKYDEVLEACSLMKDLEILSFGDQTVIGERGINLSGGQKQRIQIARALYQDADVYLFDDPFSAVDAHTGSHLFKECLLGLLRSKTIIYVTHQVEFLPAADIILVSYSRLVSSMYRVDKRAKHVRLQNFSFSFYDIIRMHA
ncbi:ABC transporter C family member 3 like [Actinidia chinensis var. chinensis]|uniref:ABC-type xenobiotic transporter n=1 Tax=Actinidia chinensis var. chinensis TaxID=1590841 RepID=A0A2R6P544_ACTCC|nr:ABC transporter C family member 3 like [Actinidia chinensis var. chinensis]